RDHRVESRRPHARLRAVDPRSAARNCRRRRRKNSCARRQRLQARQRSREGHRARRERGLPRPRASMGPWRVRPRRRSTASGNHADRVPRRHGKGGLHNVEGARSHGSQDQVSVSGSAPGMQDGTRLPKERLPPRQELVNVLEFEEAAKIALDAGAYATVAGGDRVAFDKITFRPRVMVSTLDLDLSVELFGETHFAPILVGPVADQRRFHADGELATVRGASAALAALVATSRSSVPIGEIAAQAKTPLWFSVYADGDARSHIDRALAAGCKIVCIAAPPVPPATAIPWTTIA